MSECVTRWLHFPPILEVDPKRLPRSGSYGGEWRCGQCLIGILEKGSDVVQVRTCHKHGSDIIVENIRPWVAFARKRINTFSMKLKTLLDSGWECASPPFYVDEPVPNFMGEVRLGEFKRTFASNRSDQPKLHGASKPQTPASHLIRLHYQQLDVNRGWNAERVTQLCNLLNLTAAELGEIVCWDPRKMERLARSGPNTCAGQISGPVALWLHYLEGYAKLLRLGIKPPKTFPDILEHRMRSVA